MSDTRRSVDDQNVGHPPVGRKPPTEPDFYLQWGKENAKEFIKNANAALGQLLTLSTALLGGSIAFWANIPIDVHYRFVVVAMLLSTVLVCLFSAMPSEGTMDLKSASDIRAYMEHVFAYKRKRLRIAKWSLFASLIIMMFGLIITVDPFTDRILDWVKVIRP